MKNWHDKYLEARSFGDRFADFITTYVGSWPSVLFHSAWFLWWFGTNKSINLLTLIVSLEAIFLCIFLQMSSNAHAARDKAEALYTAVDSQE